jgi:hypothetical protein
MPPTNEPPDTILNELHATRRQLLQQHGGVAGLAAFLRQEEAKRGDQIVKPPNDAGPRSCELPPVSSRAKGKAGPVPPVA